MTNTVLFPKLCKDCRWGHNRATVLSPPWPHDWTCMHTTACIQGSPDYVTGLSAEPRQEQCAQARLNPNRCGVGTRYWEPHP
jgi:hypothetical protein